MTRDDELMIQMIKSSTGKDAFKCSICGGFFYGWGNNPYPVTKGEDDKCCDNCNDMYVIPARIEEL